MKSNNARLGVKLSSLTFFNPGNRFARKQLQIVISRSFGNDLTARFDYHTQKSEKQSAVHLILLKRKKKTQKERRLEENRAVQMRHERIK